MNDGDAVAAGHRERLVGMLRGRGVDDDAVLGAFATVPRHRFVDRFVTFRPVAGAEDPEVREYLVGGDDDGALDAVYSPDLALITTRSTDSGATSSVSAPYLIAAMLTELDLAPGMRVLEVGAGSGYHAALMATIVGDAALITTIDIDASLVTQTKARLDALGFGGISVFSGDGDNGVVTGAPYDRIIATVGCADIAPAWVDQLADHGLLLVPLVHGGAHPRVKLTRQADRLTGSYVGYSGFVHIQGAQAGHSPWPATPPPADAPGLPVRTAALPAELTSALGPPHDSVPAWRPGEWALGFYLALRDPRASTGTGLLQHGSSATISNGELVLRGDADELVERLMMLATEWVQIGAPPLPAYQTSFHPQPAGAAHIEPSAAAHGPWHIRRLRHLQTIRLAAGEA